MIVKEIIKDYKVEILQGDTNIKIKGIEQDSRKIKEGDMFVAIKGFTVDGHGFINEAIKNGARCIIVEEAVDLGKRDITLIRVEDSQLALAKFASNFFGQPSQGLDLIGVTGTNGKTSITYLIKAIFDAGGSKSGIIGTMGSLVNGEKLDNVNTTPDSLTINKQLRAMVDTGAEYCLMETSSHALDLKRVEDMDFKIGIFSNLSEDHLDYHETMENYFKSKLSLFNRVSKYNIINIDDPFGERILEEVENPIPILTYGIDNKCHVFASHLAYSNRGVSFLLNYQDESIDIDLNLLGRFSVYNALAAASCGIAYGFDLATIKKGLEAVVGIRGRFEVVPNEEDFTVIIDFAHTPDGLEKVLTTIRQFAEGRVICLFGAGGNRDKSKRPIMGELVGRYSDLAIVTSDNPRHEDPDEIIKDIIVGVEKTGVDYIAITNRRDAIEYALQHSRPKDIILLAGKGHETYTIIKDKVIPFDEKEIVEDLLKKL